MKRILIILVIVLSAVRVVAQEGSTSGNQGVGKPVEQATSGFIAIDVDGSIKLRLIPIPDDVAPYIIYDIKGNDPSKFSVDVDRNRVLKIRERHDAKRVGITEVEVYFNRLEEISISKAETTVAGVLYYKMMDISVSNGATFQAKIDIMDLKISVSGDSYVVLEGEALYHNADVSAAKYNAADLVTMSSIVESCHNSEVYVDAEQRLEAKSTTGGKIFYKSTPEILRVEKSLFGVDPVLSK